MRSLEAMSHAQIGEPLQIRSSESLTALCGCPCWGLSDRSGPDQESPKHIRAGPDPAGDPASYSVEGWPRPDRCRADELSLFCLARPRPGLHPQDRPDAIRE